MPTFVDRIAETWSGTGTGTITLSGTAVSGPPGGFRAFSGNVTNGVTVRILIEHQTTTEWEISEGVYNSGTGTVTRATVKSSSNSGSLVNFSAGVKHVAIVDDAAWMNTVVTTATGGLTSAQLLAMLTDETGTGVAVFGTSPTITTPIIAQQYGSTASGGNALINSTTHATKGVITIGGSVTVDEVNGRLGVGTSAPSNKFEIRTAVAKATTATTVVGSFGSSDAYASQLQVGVQIHSDATAGSRYGEIYCLEGGVAYRPLVLQGGGGCVLIGTPTGGDKGAGTLNCAGDVHKNGTAFTNPDYVFEHHFSGKIERYKDNEGAAEYIGLPTLEVIEEFARENYHLPQISRECAGIFTRADKVLELIESLYLYAIDANKRIKSLEARAT